MYIRFETFTFRISDTHLMRFAVGRSKYTRNYRILSNPSSHTNTLFYYYKFKITQVLMI